MDGSSGHVATAWAVGAALVGSVLTLCAGDEGPPNWDDGASAACADEMRALLVEEVGPEILTSPAPEDNPSFRMLQDRLNGRISGEQYVWWAIYQLTAPERVPEEYRLPEWHLDESDGPDPLTIPFMAALWEFDCLSPRVRADVESLFLPESADP
jgi:hypothetical protein